MAMLENKSEMSEPIKGEIFSPAYFSSLPNKIQTLIKGEKEDWEWIADEIIPGIGRHLGGLANDVGATGEYIYWNSDTLLLALKQKLERNGKEALVEAEKVVRFVANHPDQAVKQVLAPAAILVWAASCSPVGAVPVEPTKIVDPIIIPTPEVTLVAPTPAPTSVPTETRTPTPDPHSLIIPFPTSQAFGGDSGFGAIKTPDLVREKIYATAIDKTKTFNSFKFEEFIGVLEGQTYQAIIKANYVSAENKSVEAYFLINGRGDLIQLSEQIPGLKWDFDYGSTKDNLILSDLNKNSFGIYDAVTGNINIKDYGVVGKGGMQLTDKVGFAEGQPLLVGNVVVDASGKVVSLEVMVSPNNWQKVSEKLALQINLTDQAKKAAKLQAPTPTPPEPTKIPRPALVTDFPTYGGHTNYETFAPEGTKTIYQKLYPGIGEQSIYFYYLQNEDMYNSMVTGIRYGSTGLHYDTGTVWFGYVKDSYFTGKIVDGSQEFVIDLLTSDNITIRLTMSNNVVITNGPTPPRRFYQIPGAFASPGLVRPGMIDARGKFIPKDVAGLSNSTLVNRMLQGHASGDTVEIRVTGHQDDISYALIVLSKP